MRNDARTRLRAQVSGLAWSLRERRRAEVVAMLKSCGIKAADVPLDTKLTREGDCVHLDLFARDSHTGNILRSQDGAAPETRRVAVHPSAIPRWIPAD
jgi:hypothetical protein